MKDKYIELHVCNFEMEVTNILQAKTCELTEEEKVSIIKKNGKPERASNLSKLSQMLKKKHAKWQEGYFPHFARDLNHAITKEYSCYNTANSKESAMSLLRSG